MNLKSVSSQLFIRFSQILFNQSNWLISILFAVLFLLIGKNSFADQKIDNQGQASPGHVTSNSNTGVGSVNSKLKTDRLSALIDLKGTQWRGKAFRALTKETVVHCTLAPKLQVANLDYYITVHYTGVRAQVRNLPKKLQDLFYFSTQEKTEFKKFLWSDVPYHFYLDYQGAVAEGRSLKFRVDSNTKYDSKGHVSIVVEGDDRDKMLPKQREKLFLLLDALVEKFNIRRLNQIDVHDHYASTTCPGPDIKEAVATYKQQRKDLTPGQRNVPKDILPIDERVPELWCPLTQLKP